VKIKFYPRYRCGVDWVGIVWNNHEAMFTLEDAMDFCDRIMAISYVKEERLKDMVDVDVVHLDNKVFE
jgi:hypothetical protein